MCSVYCTSNSLIGYWSPSYVYSPEFYNLLQNENMLKNICICFSSSKIFLFCGCKVSYKTHNHNDTSKILSALLFGEPQYMALVL